jgi:hypothetical protein
MHEHYKMGRICAVTMEIAESEIFPHEHHANLLEEHPSDATEIERPRLVSFSARVYHILEHRLHYPGLFPCPLNFDQYLSTYASG